MQHLFYLLTLLALSGCKTSSETAVSPDTTYVIASIETSGCLGRCPVYQVYVYNDRSIRFKGIAHTQVVGEAVDTLSNIEWQALLGAMHQSRFLDLDTAYLEPIMDAPTTTIFLSMEGKTRKVQCRGDAPPAFRLMQRKLEELADARAWVRGAARRALEETNELIIELHAAADLDALVAKYTGYDLTMVRRLGPNHQIYLFSVSIEDKDKSALLNVLKNDDLVKEVQWNRKLKQRK